MGNTRKMGVSSLHFGERVLTVGDKFPEFDLTARVSLEKGKEFQQINHKTYEGQWKVVFRMAQGLHLRVPRPRSPPSAS